MACCISAGVATNNKKRVCSVSLKNQNRQLIMRNKYTLVDAEEVFRQNPDEIDIPCVDCRMGVEPGDLVLVEVDDIKNHGEFSELIWILVNFHRGTSYMGKVCSPVEFTDKHGIKQDDILVFKMWHIFDICSAEEMTSAYNEQ